MKETMIRSAAALERADDALHACLTGRAGRIWRIAMPLLTAAAFLLLMSTRTLALLDGADTAVRLCTLGLLALPALVMALQAADVVKRRAGSALELLMLCALAGAAMLARVSFIERSAGDYDFYLAGWIDQLAGQSFSKSMRGTVGEYNVLYQYILFALTRLPVVPLYAVKAVSFLGDAMLAGGMARLCAREGKPSAAAYAAALLLPTAILNGGMFAQCDSLYAACAVWALALAIEGRHTGSAACFALALSFKLQAAFVLPVVVVLWAGRRLRLGDALVFLMTLIAVALPAMLGGKSPAAILGVYTAQTGIYTGLCYNAASLFGLMETAGLDVYAYGNFAMALAAGVCIAIAAWGVSRAQALDADGVVRIAMLMVTAAVYLLPRMHERYFYLADMLALALACRDRRYAPAAALMALASLAAYWETAIPLAAASAMVLAAWAYACALPGRNESAPRD